MPARGRSKSHRQFIAAGDAGWGGLHEDGRSRSASNRQWKLAMAQLCSVPVCCFPDLIVSQPGVEHGEASLSPWQPLGTEPGEPSIAHLPLGIVKGGELRRLAGRRTTAAEGCSSVAEDGERVGLAPDEPNELIVPGPIPGWPAGFRVGFDVEAAEKIEDGFITEAALAQGADLPKEDGVRQGDGAKLIL